MLRRLRRGLFWLSRSRPMGWLVRLAFARFWWLLPVRRVAETSTLLAFEHPAPSWQPHILLVPKRSVKSLVAARPADAVLVGQIVRLAFGVAASRRLDTAGFALLVNGGAYQDVPQLHFHLAGLDAGLRYELPTDQIARMGSHSPLARSTHLAAYPHPRPQREVHLVMLLDRPQTWRDLAGPDGERIGVELVSVSQILVTHLALGAPGGEPGVGPGFTLLASVRPGRLDDPVCFHLVAGRRAIEADTPTPGTKPG
ncbi:MAG: HIT domain-containing protein [Chloroflexota bacterium]